MAELCTLAVVVVTGLLVPVVAEAVVLFVCVDVSPSSCVHPRPLRSWFGKAVSSDWSCATRHAGWVRGMSSWKKLGTILLGDSNRDVPATST